MNGSELTSPSFWWIVPLIMMILCYFMMRRRRGSMMCCSGERGRGDCKAKDSDTAEEILDKRYASGEIERDEYEKIRKTITGSTNKNLE